jgi:hypothetical protein
VNDDHDDLVAGREPIGDPPPDDAPDGNDDDANDNACTFRKYVVLIYIIPKLHG